MRCSFNERKVLLHTKIISFTLMTLVLISRDIVANALSPQAIAKNSFDSTVLLVMEDVNGQPIGLGSGFFVRFNQIATNLHVVEGAANGYAKLVGKKSKYEINGISAIDAKRDLVILQVAASHRQLVSIADSDTVQVGDPVYAIGNPRGLEGTFSQGIISSVRKIGTDRLLQITAPVSPGSSGGPCFKRERQSYWCLGSNFPRRTKPQFCYSLKLSRYPPNTNRTS